MPKSVIPRLKKPANLQSVSVEIMRSSASGGSLSDRLHLFISPTALLDLSRNFGPVYLGCARRLEELSC